MRHYYSVIIIIAPAYNDVNAVRTGVGVSLNLLTAAPQIDRPIISGNDIIRGRRRKSATTNFAEAANVRPLTQWLSNSIKALGLSDHWRSELHGVCVNPHAATGPIFPCNPDHGWMQTIAMSCINQAMRLQSTDMRLSDSANDEVGRIVRSALHMIWNVNPSPSS